MIVDAHVLAGAYVCDALDRPELQAFEAHLALCETCALEVAELRATVAALAVAAIEPPPPGLLGRVLDQIVLTGQVDTERGTAADPATDADAFHRFHRRARPNRLGRPEQSNRLEQSNRPGGPRLPGRSARPRNRAAQTASRADGPARETAVAAIAAAAAEAGAAVPSSWWNRLRAWSPAAAMLVGLLALGTYAGYQHHQIDTLSSQSMPAGGGRVAAAADARVVISGLQSGGTATVISSRSTNEVLFSASALPALPAGKSYQLWFGDTAGMRPGPVLSPVDGSVPGVVTGQLDDAQWVAMTVEPSTGSTQPTSAQVLLLPLR